jgi:hypothetical protein
MKGGKDNFMPKARKGRNITQVTSDMRGEKDNLTPRDKGYREGSGDIRELEGFEGRVRVRIRVRADFGKQVRVTREGSGDLGFGVRVRVRIRVRVDLGK